MQNLKLIHAFPEGTIIVGIIEFKGVILIATQSGIYRMIEPDDIPHELSFKPGDDAYCR